MRPPMSGVPCHHATLVSLSISLSLPLSLCGVLCHSQHASAPARRSKLAQSAKEADAQLKAERAGIFVCVCGARSTKVFELVDGETYNR